jgi:threonyl-tRNA synthetase
MLTITLPDGAKREFPGPVTGAELAASIGPGLAKAALAIKFDGKVRDLSTLIASDAKVEIVTRTHGDALELLRHDAPMCWPRRPGTLSRTQVTFGPAIENGFYYDFARETPFTPDDLAKHRAAMREIVDRDEPITREVWSRQEAIALLPVASARSTRPIIRTCRGRGHLDLPPGRLARPVPGPHLPSTGKLGKAFKLMKVAGAYWRGDAATPAAARLRHRLGGREGAEGLPHPARGGGEARPPPPRPRDGPVPPAGRGGGHPSSGIPRAGALPHAREPTCAERLEPAATRR